MWENSWAILMGLEGYSIGNVGTYFAIFFCVLFCFLSFACENGILLSSSKEYRTFNLGGGEILTFSIT